MSKPHLEGYWLKLFGQLQANLTGVSRAEMEVQLFDVLQEFFDGSNCWTEPITVPVIANIQDYPLIPIHGRILRLWGVVDQNNVPQAAAMPEIGTLHFFYPYTNPQPMTATVVKNVTDPLLCSPPHIPDWVLPAHGLGILHGIMGYLMLQPGMSYSNAALGNFHLTKFRDAIAHARVAKMRANSIGSQAWAYPQQFRVTRQRGGVNTFNINPR
jgi:hypothetical protein